MALTPYHIVSPANFLILLMLGHWPPSATTRKINAQIVNNVYSADFLLTDNIVFQGEDHHAGGILDIHFFQYPRPVSFYGTLAQEQQLANLLGGVLSADKPDDLLFPLGEQGRRCFFLRFEFTFDDQRGQIGRRMLTIIDISRLYGQNGL